MPSAELTEISILWRPARITDSSRLVVDYHANEGRSWRLWVSADGTRAAQLPHGTTVDEAPEPADVTAWGTAHELVMFFYGRIPAESLRTEGDPGILDQLHA